MIRLEIRIHQKQGEVYAGVVLGTPTTHLPKDISFELDMSARQLDNRSEQARLTFTSQRVPLGDMQAGRARALYAEPIALAIELFSKRGPGTFMVPLIEERDPPSLRKQQREIAKQWNAPA